MSDLWDFLLFLRNYAFGHILHVGSVMDVVKDTIVELFLFKRGKYSISIINSSFIVLSVILTTTVPIIAQNNPFREQEALYAQNIAYLGNERLIALDDDSISLDTIRSKVRDKVETYTVQSGDTVQSVATKFDVSENTIRWANNLSVGKKITPGTQLKIVPVTGVAHTVVYGDTIYTIAKKYGVRAQNIVNFPFNEFKDDSFTLIAGSTIIVPEGVVSTTTSPRDDTYSFAQVVAGVRGSSNFIWPTQGIITQYPAVYHMAFDIANPSAPPVLAADSGTVIYSGCFSWGYGCHIIIDHNNGYRTLYGHLSRRDVEQGTAVSQGQQIGLMGSTGRSTGTHLHFEIRQGNTLLNPQLFLK